MVASSVPAPDEWLHRFPAPCRLEAIGHFATSAKHAAVVPLPWMIRMAGENLWNTAVSFMSSAASRKVLLEPLQTLIKCVATLKITEESDDELKEFCTKLYVVLFECLADAGRWSDGLAATEKSLKRLPASCHKSLWDFRITFMGKLGKDTTAEMLRVKESGEAMVEPPLLPTLSHTAAPPL